MFEPQNDSSIVVFVAFVSPEMMPQRAMLMAILQSAGMSIVTHDSDDNIEQLLEQADCSLHLLSNKYSATSENQLQKARKRNQILENFTVFIWQQSIVFQKIEPQQENFINSVRNNILRNMIFTNHDSPVMLTEDIRAIMTTERQVNYHAEETQIFFIYNEIDLDAASSITDLLNDVASIKSLSIILNNATDYSEMVSQQIEKSELTVIFFKRSANWAMPFTQQVWKKIGGASSGATLLLIGDGNHIQNTNAKFDAPNITSLIVAEELIPLEIKVQYDKLLEIKN